MSVGPEGSMEDVLEGLLRETPALPDGWAEGRAVDGDLVVTCATDHSVGALVEVLASSDDLPTVTAIIPKPVEKSVWNRQTHDWSVTGRATDLIDERRLGFRKGAVPDVPLVVGNDTIAPVITDGDFALGGAMAAEMWHDHLRGIVADAQLWRPPVGGVEETAQAMAEVDPDAADILRQSATGFRPSGDERLDPGSAVVLAAAASECNFSEVRDRVHEVGSVSTSTLGKRVNETLADIITTESKHSPRVGHPDSVIRLSDEVRGDLGEIEGKLPDDLLQHAVRGPAR